MKEDELIASDSFNPNDPVFGLEEKLYKRPDGTYYLDGRGGTLTKWKGAKQIGHKNITEEQALTWLNSHFNSMEVAE